MQTDRNGQNGGEKLKLLEEQGLADDTIIFYYDHGSVCQEVKVALFSGINVPLIVHVLRNGNIWLFRLQSRWEIRRRVGFIICPHPPGIAGKASCSHARPCFYG